MSQNRANLLRKVRAVHLGIRIIRRLWDQPFMVKSPDSEYDVTMVQVQWLLDEVAALEKLDED